MCTSWYAVFNELGVGIMQIVTNLLSISNNVKVKNNMITNYNKNIAENIDYNYNVMYLPLFMYTLVAAIYFFFFFRFVFRNVNKFAFVFISMYNHSIHPIFF